MLDINHTHSTDQGADTALSNGKSGIGSLSLKRSPVRSMEHAATTSTTSPDEPDKGGEGGEPGLPPLPVSNAEFLAHVTRGTTDDARAAICSKPGDPQEGGWTAMAADDVDRQCPTDRNNYFNCSSFVVDEDGRVRAKLDGFSGFHALVLDDVGTKVDRARLAGITPSWEVETSPGNSQVGFVLAEPLRDLKAVERLQQAAIRADLCDPGAGGAARWVRLPNAINGKVKYRDGAGQPFACRLVQWHPDVSFTVDALGAALGLDLRTPAVSLAVPAARRMKLASPTVVIGSDVWTPAPTENPVITALTAQGLYKREISPGVHDVTCPWSGEHTDAIDSGAAYFEPDIDHSRGGYKCQHSHGDKYHVGELLDFLGVDRDAARARPRIDVVPGELNRVRRAAELSLSLRGGFYQMDGAIVTIRTDPRTGDVSVERLTEAALTSELSEAADWYRFDGRSKGSMRIDPPMKNVTALLKAQQFEFLPVLTGVARQPFFRDDGSLVTAAGYDTVSGFYGGFDGNAYALPEPTEAAARVALAKLDGLLNEFRFFGPVDRSAALSAMLTAAVRPSLIVAPAFSITASTPGSGKSYLASIIIPFAGPGHAAKVSYPTSTEEASKAMLAALMSNPAAIVFDDMQVDWKPFSALNRMLTSETITERILGTNATMTVSTRSLILGTGNNIGPVRDMARRVVTIRLHHRVATPALERYEGQPAETVAKARAEYVVAALTIVAAWQAAGSPRADLLSIASYGEWSDLCRQSLVWLGLPDPAASLIEQINHDPDQDLLGRLLRAWNDVFGERPITVRKLMDDLHDHEDLHDALVELPVTDRDFVNRDRLGWYLKRNVNRVVDGLELQRVDNAHRTSWRVVAVRV